MLERKEALELIVKGCSEKLSANGFELFFSVEEDFYAKGHYTHYTHYTITLITGV
jgi:hypothetical protein